MNNYGELWRDLIVDGSVKLFWNKDIFAKYNQQIALEGFEIYSFDCSSWDNTNFHNELSSTLRFPDYYGQSLDAFNDCLSDMEPKDKGFVLTFENFDAFAEKQPEIAYHLLDIIQTSAWRFLIQNKILMAFVQSNDAKLNFPPLGGMTADWNNEEWLDENRGL